MSESNAETLIGLVEHYSPSGQEREAVDWLVAHMGRLGYTRAYRDEAGNAVGVIGDGPKQIVLIGHIDTVPGEIKTRREGDDFYGRGSVDAKGPLACFTDAVAATGAAPGWQLVVVGAVEEERDSEGARFAAGVYHPQFAIVGEPNRWDRVALGYKGAAWAGLTVRRGVAHTAGQQESACEAAAAVWQRVLEWSASYNQGRERAFERVLPTLRAMQSGGDGFEEWARLRIGVRLPVDLAPAAWYQELAGLAGEAQIEPQGYPLPAHVCDKNTALVRAFLGGIRATGGTPSFVYKTGTADLNIVGPAWGCPALVYGPGDSALDHTPDEHISLDEYAKSVAALQAALRTLVAGE